MPRIRIHLFLVGVDGDTHAPLLHLCRQRWPALPVTAAPNGDAALAALRNPADLAKVTPPFLFLLDMRQQPAAAGLSFLNALRQDPVLRPWPVFVLGDSDQPHEVGALYDLGVAAYLRSTAIGDHYQQLAGMLDAYLSVVEFPAPTLVR